MADWLALTQALERTMTEHAPGWTDRNDADPGLTTLEMLAYLAEHLRLHRDVVEGGASAARRAVEALSLYARPESIATRADGHSSWSGVKRVRFFTGRLLTAEDLSDEQAYHLGKYQRHLQTLHGSGVVSGLRVEIGPDGGTITIDPGLAIDSHGREILLIDPVTLPVPVASSSPAWLVLDYAERHVDPVPASAGNIEASRIEEGCTVRIALSPSSGVAVARLIHEPGGWRVDRSFVPTRLC